jgi:hypothetical protein
MTMARDHAQPTRGIGLSTAPLRSVRAYAAVPRLLLYGLVGILCIAGLRAAVAGPAESAAPPPPPVELPDTSVAAFAEGFARTYLTWDEEHSESREEALSTYLADQLEDDGGLSPGDGSVQDVSWTAVVAAEPGDERTLVTVAAQTTSRLAYLSVPVARDDRGFLTVADYPAFVGPPATSSDYDPPPEDEVDERQLAKVVERAVGNYLGRSVDNLRADLTPGAVVSLPPESMQLTDTDSITWVEEPSRVAIQVEAEDDAGDSWTLRYELEVTKSDRWYVRSLQVDPTFQGGVR